MTVVASETHLEIELLRDPPQEVDFGSSEEEASYAAVDLELADRVHAVIVREFASQPEESLIFTNLDWWPNRSRSVSVDSRTLSRSVVASLAALLVGEYSEWRIHVNVFRSLATDVEVEVGSLCLLPGRIIVQSSLCELLAQ